MNFSRTFKHFYYFIIKKFFVYTMLNVWVFTEVRRESGPPDLAFQAIVSLLMGMLRTEHASSGRA